MVAAFESRLAVGSSARTNFGLDARALATATLDSKSATTLLEIMEKLNHEEKITFIFSTHDARVVKMAHRVITLEDGMVVSDEIRE